MPHDRVARAGHQVGADAGGHLVALGVEVAGDRAGRGVARVAEVGALDQLEASARRAIGLSIAVPQTSPSPCVACVSPIENRAPGTSTGR